MTIFDRRQFLKTGAMLGAGLGMIGNAPFMVVAQAKERFTGVTYLPPSYTGLMWGMQGFVDRLKKKAGDSADVEFYHSGQLVKADEQVPALRSGSIQWMFHTSAYINRSFPIMGVFGLPSLVGELYDNPSRLKIGSPLFNLINEQLAKQNLIMLSSGGGVAEPEYIWSGKTPVKSVADLKGKKIRVVSFEASEAMKLLGVAPVRLKSSETYLALQRGTVDAAVANISTVVGRRLDEQLKYCLTLPVTSYSIAIFMLKSTYEKLDPKLKAALDESSKWYDEHHIKHLNDDVYPNDYWPRMKKAGIERIAPDDAGKAKFRDVSKETWAIWKKEVGEAVGDKAIQLIQGKG